MTKGPASALVLHLQPLPNELSLSFFHSLSAFLSTHTLIQHAQTAVQLVLEEKNALFWYFLIQIFFYKETLSFVHDLYAVHMTHCLIAHLILSNHMIIGQTDHTHDEGGIPKHYYRKHNHMIWICTPLRIGSSVGVIQIHPHNCILNR